MLCTIQNYRTLLIAGLSSAALAACQVSVAPPSFDGPFEYEGKVKRPVGAFQVSPVQTVRVEMRDGVGLETDIYLPRGSETSAAILIRTPYNKAAFKPEVSQTGTVATFVEHGYAVLVQDPRGRFGSEGAYAPLFQDDVDSYDTMDWIIEQDWSNGVIGTFGCSYLGETQIAAAPLKHPAWKAAIPMASGGANGGVNGRDRQFALWNGGAFELAMGLSWFEQYGGVTGVDKVAESPGADKPSVTEVLDVLPVSSALSKITDKPTQFEEFVTQRPGSTYWSEFPYLNGDETVSVPALFIEGWYDYGPQETIEQFLYFQENSGAFGDAHRVVMDPTIHCAQHTLTEDAIVGERSIGDARLDFFALYLNWFDYWLRGEENGANQMPLITYYRMGDNSWQTSDVWPVAGAQETKFYLRFDNDQGATLSETVDPDAASRSYQYDPMNPLPTLGAPVCCTSTDDGESLEGAFDQSPNEARDDVLIFETPALSSDLNVTGPVTATLFVASDKRDTDFTVKLIDVYPDGRAFNVVDGIQRMRWREGFEAPKLMVPGEVYEVQIDLQATSNVFKKGHRVRVEVSSSNFPRFTRNLNTGKDNHQSTEYEIAFNTVFLGAEKASYITLPVVVGDDNDGDS